MTSPNGRVLGHSTSGTDPSDNPYLEISSLDDPTPTESSSLLPSKARRVRAKRPYGTTRTPSSDSAGAREEDPVLPDHLRHPRRPLRLKLSFLFACFLLYVNFSFLILTISAVRSPFMAHNSLPSHKGSLFLPIWLCLLSLATNSLTLLAFSAPLESPHLASSTSLLSAVLLVIDLILILSVGQLRHKESVLTLVLIGIAIISVLHAATSALLAERYAPLLDPPPPRTQIHDPGFFASLKRVAKGIVAFLGVSLPIALLHIAIVAAFALLTFSVIVRAYDASLTPDGLIFKVNPWRKRHGGSVTESNGKPYNLHLACRGIRLDNPPVFLEGVVPNATVEQEVGFPRPLPVRRTVLVETEQGIPGKIGAGWILDMLRDGELTSADTEVRVCYYDRPGYGFSDNSPSGAVPHVVTALYEALQLSGEIARLEPSPRPYDISSSATPTSELAPSPTAIPGFVMVASRYGSLTTTRFAALHPLLVHSILYLSPTPPALHYASRAVHGLFHPFTFFFTTVLRSFSSELGIWRAWSVFRGKGREYRVYSTESQEIEGSIMRSFLQEEGEKHDPNSDSARAWENVRTRYPDRPTIVFNEAAGKRAWRQGGYSQSEWEGAQIMFMKDVVRDGLVHEVTDFEGNCYKDQDRCRKALLQLVKMD